MRHTLLAGRVLRSGDRPGAEQELWALLTLYQLLRRAMVEAVETRPGTNPDRASFTTALVAARDQLTAAAGIFPQAADLPGAIGCAVLATLLPARRPRFSARKVTCATSRYLNHGDQRPHTVTAITAISVTMRTPPLRDSASARRPYRRTCVLGPRRPTHRELITAIITSQPPRDGTPRELAIMLGVHPRPLATQLREWSLLGFFTRTGLGAYRLNQGPGKIDDRPVCPVASGWITARDITDQQWPLLKVTYGTGHQDRIRENAGALPAQHADTIAILDNRAGPLTTRHCCAMSAERSRYR